MKKRLMLVVSLLAIASLMAAMAFTSASVTSDASFSVVNTDSALLALTPSDFHDAAYLGGTHPSNAQKLVINWDKGYNGQEFGVQPNSEYIWDDLFEVKNNSEHPIDVKVFLDPDHTSNTTNIFFAKTRVASRWENVGGTPLEFKLNPGEGQWISTKINSSEGMSMKAKKVEFKLMVEAETVTQAP